MKPSKRTAQIIDKVAFATLPMFFTTHLRLRRGQCFVQRNPCCARTFRVRRQTRRPRIKPPGIVIPEPLKGFADTLKHPRRNPARVFALIAARLRFVFSIPSQRSRGRQPRRLRARPNPRPGYSRRGYTDREYTDRAWDRWQRAHPDTAYDSSKLRRYHSSR